MAETAVLERLCAFTGTVGSNPTLSADNIFYRETETGSNPVSGVSIDNTTEIW